MASLKVLKVENHVIFPAAAFVETALEASVQLFEGRVFVAEDFNPKTPEECPPFRSYGYAFQDLVQNLANPRVGAQWREATAAPRDLANAG
jgi:hypothetical protein